jgi:hypothetical protein
LAPVEFLQEGDSKWVLGQDLPTPIRDSVMVTDHNGAAVIIGGLSPDAYYVGQVSAFMFSRVVDNFVYLFIAALCRMMQNALINGRAHIRHQCRKKAVLSCHRFLINSGVEKMNNI